MSTNVYLVDDDTDGLKWLADLGRRWNLRVVRFSSAERFLDTVRPGGRGVVLVEASLPGMNGLELHEELVKRGYRLPTIITAKNGDVSMAVEALKAGAEDYLEKPVIPQVLLRRICSTLARTRTPDRGVRKD